MLKESLSVNSYKRPAGLSTYQKWQICLVVLNITPKQYANRAGVSKATVYRYYGGKRKEKNEHLDHELDRHWFVACRMIYREFQDTIIKKTT